MNEHINETKNYIEEDSTSTMFFRDRLEIVSVKIGNSIVYTTEEKYESNRNN